jgi:thiamine biosynthesis lipoprotein
MGSPCEVQVDTPDAALGERLGAIAQAEALRIEHKYSRYRPDSVVAVINAGAGKPVPVDPETAGLITFADQCHGMSEGRFDITSGALRRVWTFDGSDRVPDPAAVARCLLAVGWDKAVWNGAALTLQPGMEIDLGGIAKEYAVDMALAKVMQHDDVPVLVNFGGDLRVSGRRADGSRWRVLIDAIGPDQAAAWLEIANGAITTSGDARRFVLRDGVRYGHIIDPLSGMPVVAAPRSITVAAATCIEAGILSTLAMLHGEQAESFLKTQGVAAWVAR